jgi:hypothetical protein
MTLIYCTNCVQAYCYLHGDGSKGVNINYLLIHIINLENILLILLLIVNFLSKSFVPSYAARHLNC